MDQLQVAMSLLSLIVHLRQFGFWALYAFSKRAAYATSRNVIVYVICEALIGEITSIMDPFASII